MYSMYACIYVCICMYLAYFFFPSPDDPNVVTNCMYVTARLRECAVASGAGLYGTCWRPGLVTTINRWGLEGGKMLNASTRRGEAEGREDRRKARYAIISYHVISHHIIWYHDHTNSSKESSRKHVAYLHVVSTCRYLAHPAHGSGDPRYRTLSLSFIGNLTDNSAGVCSLFRSSISEFRTGSRWRRDICTEIPIPLRGKNNHNDTRVKKITGRGVAGGISFSNTSPNMPKAISLPQLGYLKPRCLARYCAI